MSRVLLISALILVLILAGPAMTVLTGEVRLDRTWRGANRDPVGLAPDPATHPEAVIQFYAARALAWRGAFAVHTWIAIKPQNAPRYVVHEVIGWRHYRGAPALASSHRPPDGRWFGATPQVIADVRGKEAEALLPRLTEAIRDYPLKDQYRVWPGPNSNTFTAHIARNLPALNVDMPATAIGKDWLPGTVFAPTPSNKGFQFNVLGVLGAGLSRTEGLELHVAGLTFGIDLSPPSLKLPGIGRFPDYSKH